MKSKLLLMLLAIALAAGVAQAEMLTNPGFEAGVYAPKNVPDGWTAYSPTFTSGWTWRSTGGIGGGKCLSMHGAPLAVYTSGTILQWVPVIPGEEYTFSVWAKSPTQGKAATPYGYFTWLDSASTWVGAPSYGFLSPDISIVGDDWTEVSFGAITAPQKCWFPNPCFMKSLKESNA